MVMEAATLPPALVQVRRRADLLLPQKTVLRTLLQARLVVVMLLRTALPKVVQALRCPPLLCTWEVLRPAWVLILVPLLAVANAPRRRTALSTLLQALRCPLLL
jgi:hypothetical protein